MAKPTIYAVQTLVRVVFTDGTVASLMLPPGELDPASSISEVEQATGLMESQGAQIREHVGTIGPEGLHDAATAEHKQRQEDVQRRADEAEAKKLQRAEADAKHCDGSGPAE